MGIYAEDSLLWSETIYIRKLLKEFGVETSSGESTFRNWDSLPNLALLSTKWHLENSKPYWHWVVFVREENQEYVLDSKKALKTNVRKDFWRIKPKWFIEVRV